jgi:hypothetical protein
MDGSNQKGMKGKNLLLATSWRGGTNNFLSSIFRFLGSRAIPVYKNVVTN